jgi:hypothetical protein
MAEDFTINWSMRIFPIGNDPKKGKVE